MSTREMSQETRRVTYCPIVGTSYDDDSTAMRWPFDDRFDELAWRACGDQIADRSVGRPSLARRQWAPIPSRERPVVRRQFIASVPRASAELATTTTTTSVTRSSSGRAAALRPTTVPAPISGSPAYIPKDRRRRRRRIWTPSRPSNVARRLDKDDHPPGDRDSNLATRDFDREFIASGGGEWLTARVTCQCAHRLFTLTSSTASLRVSLFDLCNETKSSCSCQIVYVFICIRQKW